MSVAERETYGQKFKRLRTELGFSQAEAARYCGVSVHTASDWERDKRTFISSDQTQYIRKAIGRLMRRKQYREGRG